MGTDMKLFAIDARFDHLNLNDRCHLKGMFEGRIVTPTITVKSKFAHTKDELLLAFPKNYDLINNIKRQVGDTPTSQVITVIEVEYYYDDQMGR